MKALSIKQWVKMGDDPFARGLKNTWFTLRYFQCPRVPGVHTSLLALHRLFTNSVQTMLRVFYYTPLFQTYLKKPSRYLYLYGGLPAVLGNLSIDLGNYCRIAGMSTISGRGADGHQAELIIGNNVDIGWQNNIAVGSKIVLGNNVRLAPRVTLAGYSGHPLEAEARAQGLPEHSDQRKAIVLEDDVWLASGVIVNAGVTIGRGTVVAAGSVVTKSLPPNVLAGGNPARVIKAIDQRDEAGI